MELVQKIISRYKTQRSLRQLRTTYDGGYAFVGMGGHSTQNLYPVLDYLHVPLKYVCVRTEEKAAAIGRKYSGVQATTSLQTVLDDESVKGVFVSASPSAHFAIASQVLASGKSLLVEKPPCQSLDELQRLVELEQGHGSCVAMAGMQKRFSPLTQTLMRRLRKDTPCSYNLRYLTGLYPEGNALLDLFIHPLDLVCHLFGEAEVLCASKVDGGNGAMTLLVTLRHGAATGLLELSTAYTWTDAQEEITVNTQRGRWRMRQMEELTFTGKQGSCLGIPLEKVLPRTSVTETVFSRNNFTPTMANNQVVTQGYYGEIKAFVDCVEGRAGGDKPSLLQLLPTYALLRRLDEMTGCGGK